MSSRLSAGHHEPACLSGSFQVDKFWAFILVILPDEHEGKAPLWYAAPQFCWCHLAISSGSDKDSRL